MTPFKVEAWIWYGFAMSMVLLRILARYLHFKAITRLQVEDWLMLFIACCYTIFMVFINISAVTSSNLIDPSDIPHLTAEDIKNRIWGSKAILVVEQCMCAVQWGTKACLLILYSRLTENLVGNLLIKGTAIYVALTYIVMEVLYFAVWCRPFSDYWETPTDNVQCTTALNHLIVNLVFNLTSDLLIMSIPLPLVLRAHLEFKRKVLLTLPFTLGFFSIVCAILSKHLSFTEPFSGYWVFWYTREASTVMIVSNMPYTWGLVRRVFNVRSFFGSSETPSRANSPNLARTWSSGMGMFHGELSELRGIAVPGPVLLPGNADHASDLNRISSRGSSKGRLFSFDSWKKRQDKGVERLSSAMPSREGAAQTLSDAAFAESQWVNLHLDKREVDIGLDVAGSGTTSAATSDGQSPPAFTIANTRKASYRCNADAIDRLYRLDDGDLVADMEKENKRSQTKEFG